MIILSAKHGQSPDTPSALTRIPDGPIIDALNAAWHTAHPSGVNPLVAFSVNDDGMLIWLNDRSDTATAFAKAFLLEPLGHRQRHQRQPEAVHQLRPEPGVRRR